MALSLTAIVIATLFSGAALYISLVEHPVRSGLDDTCVLAQWKPSYKRALPIQAGLAVLGGIVGLVVWYGSRDWRWLAGSLTLLANWPFTMLVILPNNKRLMAISLQNAGTESRDLLRRWGGLHGVRSALGCFSVLLFLWGASA